MTLPVPRTRMRGAARHRQDGTAAVGDASAVAQGPAVRFRT